MKERIKKAGKESFDNDGGIHALGGIRQPEGVITGVLRDDTTLTADAQKKKLLEWLEGGTTVYILASNINDRCTYAGITEIIGQYRYAPAVLLSIDFSNENNDINAVIDYRFGAVIVDGMHLMAVEDWETIPQPDTHLVAYEDWETIPQPSTHLVATEDWET